jgi:anti-anti-sigma factor
MNIQIETLGDVDVVRPGGRLDSTSAGVFERAIGEVFDRGSRKMVLDLSRVDYVSSAGLRAALIAGKRMRAIPGGKLVLCALAPAVREVFEISGFVSIFAIQPSVDAAVVACGGSNPAAN